MKKIIRLMATLVAFSSTAILHADATTAVTPATPSKKTWAQKHPRRAQVNHREHKQVKKTKQDVATGKLTAAQGKQLNKEDRQVRQEERDMASQNNGHITKQEQKTLDSQEN